MNSVWKTPFTYSTVYEYCLIDFEAQKKPEAAIASALPAISNTKGNASHSLIKDMRSSAVINAVIESPTNNIHSTDKKSTNREDTMSLVRFLKANIIHILSLSK